MPRVSLNQMRAVVDPQMTFDWLITVPNIPGIADSREFTIRATSTSAPGRQVEAVLWEGHGMKLHFAGRMSHDETWTVSAIEGRDGRTRKMAVAWLEASRSWRQNSGGYKSEYAVPVNVTLLDAKGKATHELILHGTFMTQLSAATMDQSSGIMSYEMTFSIDEVEEQEPTV